MITLRQLSLWLMDIRGFNGLLGVYEDLAAQKMQKIRGEITKHRQYADMLTKMSGDLGVDISTVIKKNEKQRSAVLITSDKGLYGSAFDGLGKEFFEFLSSNQADAFVIGGMGVDLMKANSKASFVEIAADKSSLDSLWSALSQYQEINIFYLRHDSLAKQSMERLKISGDALPQDGQLYEYDKTKQLRYIYEPSVSEVVDVFAKEVLSFLAEQTMKESDLAKFAARLMYLDGCLERNTQNLSKAMKQKMTLTKRQINRSQNARMVNYLIRN